MMLRKEVVKKGQGAFMAKCYKMYGDKMTLRPKIKLETFYDDDDDDNDDDDCLDFITHKDELEEPRTLPQQEATDFNGKFIN